MTDDEWNGTDDENRGRVSRVIFKNVSDGGDQQEVDYDGVADETHTEVLRIQPHGFASHPPEGSEGVMVSLSSRDAPVVVGGEHPESRKKYGSGLKAGGSRQYDTAGSMVDLDADGNVLVKANGKDVTVDGAKQVVVKGGDKVVLQVGGCSITISAGGIEVVGDITQKGGLTSTGAHKAAAHV